MSALGRLNLLLACVLSSAYGVELTSLRSGRAVKVGFPVPSRFLLVSSPKEQKVCYAALNGDMEAASGHVSPLIDSGLKSPAGLAVDRRADGDVVMYVADTEAGAVWQYKLKKQVDRRGNERLIADGRQLAIVQGDHEPRWVAVDAQHNLFFTDQRANTIRKISYELIRKLERSQVLASQLVTAEQSVPETILFASGGVTRAPPPVYKIVTVYQGSSNGMVSKPSGIVADGIRLYWGNSADGVSRGSVVKGYEQAPLNTGAIGGPVNTTYKMATNIQGTQGVAAASNGIFYSDTSSAVYGVPRTGGAPQLITDQFDSPRGLVWDGDGTVYVADQTGGGGTVYSFASSRVGPTSIRKTVPLHDAFGLAVVLGDKLAIVGENGSTNMHGLASPLLLAALCAVTRFL